jgi:hypothetical protein
VKVYEVVFELFDFSYWKRERKTIGIYSSFDSAVKAIENRDPLLDASKSFGHDFNCNGISSEKYNRFRDNFSRFVGYNDNLYICGKYTIQEFDLQE